MSHGQKWKQMDTQVRRPAARLSRPDVPAEPGVYAWYRDGQAVYSGRAIGSDGLRGRVWKDHLNTKHDLSRSSFRRNVCEHLGVAPTSRTRLRPTDMTPDEVAPINVWIRECDVAWIEFTTDAAAAEFEKALHAEWLPPLSKR